jgi:hypothetical protein
MSAQPLIAAPAGVGSMRWLRLALIVGSVAVVAVGAGLHGRTPTALESMCGAAGCAYVRYAVLLGLFLHIIRSI